MKKIGLVGGLSWISTAAYYKRLNQLVQARVGGVSSARLVLESVNRQTYVDAVIEREDERAACDIVLAACQNLERAGASFIVMSCNDIHRFVPEIAAEIDIPFLHIAEATARAVLTRGLNHVGLLGVRKTMECDFYPQILNSYGIETIIPSEPGRSYVHDKIYSELVCDIFTDDTRNGYLKVIDDLTVRGAEGIILGCTEIPLLLSSDQINIPSFSTTELHCLEAIEWSLNSHQ